MLDEILKHIPHRPPFLFLDEIIESGPDRVLARRTVRGDEPHFAGHYPGNPIMPGVLLCEAIMQAGTVAMSIRAAAEGGLHGTTPLVAKIEEARFKQRVVPGDVLDIEAVYREKVGGFHFLSGKVMKDDKLAVSLRFAVAIAFN